MAEIAIVPEDVTRPPAGALDAEAPSAALVAADHWSIPNNGRTFLQFIGGAAAVNLTIQTPATLDGLAVDDRTYSLPANRRSKVIGPLPVEVYGDTLRVDVDAAGARVIAFRL